MALHKPKQLYVLEKKRKKEMHPEIKESLKLSDKGSYYKQEDFYYSTDENNEYTNSNSEQVLSASSTKALLHNQKPQLTQGLQEILVLQKVCNTSELNVNKRNK
jgi:hypothetical protein